MAQLPDGSVIKVDGARADGKQAMEADAALTEYSVELTKVLAGENTPIIPSALDELMFVEKNGGQVVHSMQIQAMFAAMITEAFATGSISIAIGTGPAFQTIPAFGATYYSSSPQLTASGDDTGITTTALPIRYNIHSTISFTGTNNTEFIFQIHVDGEPIGREVTATGLGTGSSKTINLALFGVSGVAGIPAEKIDVRVKDSGGSIATLDADMFVSFAGV